MNILILYNNPDRELSYLNEIKISLLKNYIVENVILENGGDTKKVVVSVLKFKPAVILSYPLTGKLLPYKFHVLKLFLRFKLICLRTEGAILKSSKENILAHAGIAKYSNKLVDLELFWGKAQKKLLGPELLRQNKITSLERCLIVGYPRIRKVQINSKDKKWIGIFTGFQQADYDAKRFLKAKDLGKSNIKEYLGQAKKVLEFREEFIERLDAFLISNKNIHFIIKPHPGENEMKYHLLSNHENLKILPKSMSLNLVFENLKSFVHFGSTTLLDAYIYKIPSLLFFDKASNIGHSYGWKSTIKSSLKELDFSIKLLDKTNFEITDEIKVTLQNEIDFDFNKPYDPVERIVDVILFNKSPKQVPSFLSKHTFISFLQLVRLIFLRFIFYRNND